MVDSSDPEELASVIERALADKALHRRVGAASDDFRRFYTWDRAARQMLAVLFEDIGALEDAQRLMESIPPKPH